MTGCSRDPLCLQVEGVQRGPAAGGIRATGGGAWQSLRCRCCRWCSSFVPATVLLLLLALFLFSLLFLLCSCRRWGGVSFRTAVVVVDISCFGPAFVDVVDCCSSRFWGCFFLIGVVAVLLLPLSFDCCCCVATVVAFRRDCAVQTTCGAQNLPAGGGGAAGGAGAPGEVLTPTRVCACVGMC